VPPPPVSGAEVGNGRVDGMTVCVLAGCVACGVVVGCDAAEVRDAVDVCDADGLPDAEADARAEALLPPDDVAVDLVEALLEAAWPVGDGVRVPGWVADEPVVRGDGVGMDGVPDPVPPMHPETVTASNTAPAAERPANSQPECASGVVRRIFMNPPPI
jgi:hypothetical protein